MNQFVIQPRFVKPLVPLYVSFAFLYPSILVAYQYTFPLAKSLAVALHES